MKDAPPPRSGPGGTVRLDDPSDFRTEVVRAIKTRLAPALVVIAGPDVGVSARLERSITIGRDPEAGLALADTSVSFHHARVEDRGDAWAVVDLGSTNGTRVDDVRAAETLLRHGSKIQIGTTVIRFEVQDESDQAYDEMVQRMISIDDLSGLYVRRRFDRELAQMIATAGRDPVALLVMDLDGIKKINDTHGHLFGAHVIGEAGRRIQHTLEHTTKGAIACRFGGDEYLVASKGLDADAAYDLAESIRAAIAVMAYEKDGVELRVGASVGVATFPADARDAAALFQRADEAMYRAKQAGKNRVSR
jgi:diguanylate cyclase (GGDEF)-like protein